MGLLLYNQNKWWYKAITVILVLALIVMISIGVAPRAKAVVGVATVVVSAVLAAMAAFGISTIISGMTSSQIEDYIGGKLQDWATSVGSPLDTLINSSLIGKTASSVFAIGAAAANGISDFINWLINDENIEDDDSTTIYASNGVIPIMSGVAFSETIYNQSTYVGINNNLENRAYIYNSNDFTPAKLTYVRINNSIVPFVIHNASGQVIFIVHNGNMYGAGIAGYVLNKNTTYDPSNTYYMTPQVRMTDTVNNTVTGVNEYIFDSPQEALQAAIDSYSISIVTGTIDIPTTVANEDNLYLDVGAPSVADVAGLADYVLDQVADNQLVSDYEIAEAPPVPSVGDINVDSYSPGAISQIEQAIQASIQSALENAGTIEVELVNDTPLSVNTDHHAFGFDLPDITFNFASIWHYVSDAVSYSSLFISWFVSLFTSIPILSIPLYCCFTLVVVLGAFRRFLL